MARITCDKCGRTTYGPARAKTKCCGRLARTAESPGPRIRVSSGGPGTELLKIIPKALMTSTCRCDQYARKMDRWNNEGCEERAEEIVAHMVKQAQNHVALKHIPVKVLRWQASRWLRAAIAASRDAG